MLRNKKVNIVLSLLMAVALWAFVIGEVNPETSRLYREVPIEFVNEEVLDANGMALLSVSDRSVNVTLNGSRSEINQINKSDITAVVDMEEAVLGQNLLELEIKVSGKAEVESQSVNKVTVVVEERTEKEVEILITYRGTYADDEEPITVEQSLERVYVSGAVSNVEKVVAAEAAVESGAVNRESKSFSCQLTPIDSHGNAVRNVSLSIDTVDVTAELAHTKTVPLIVNVIDTESDPVKRTVEVPETIVVKGRSSVLESIDSVSAEDVIVDGVTEETTIPVKPILPADVEVSAESADLTVVVHVDRTGTKTFSYNKGDIKVLNIGKGLKGTVETASVEVELQGDYEYLESLEKDSVQLSVDMTGLGEGTHKVTVAASNDGDVTTKVEPAEVTVLLEKTDKEVAADADTDVEDNNIDDNGDIEE